MLARLSRYYSSLISTGVSTLASACPLFFDVTNLQVQQFEVYYCSDCTKSSMESDRTKVVWNSKHMSGIITVS